MIKILFIITVIIISIKGNVRKTWKVIFESSLGELVKKSRIM